MFELRRLPILLALLVVALVGTLITAASGQESWPAPLSGGCSSGSSAAGTFPVTFVSGGLQRSALVHVPVSALGHKAPLVVALHGAHRSGPLMESYSGLSRVADHSGFVVVYPSALGAPPFWTLGATPVAGQADDVAFVRELVARLQSGACLDATRTYAMGVSNGGGLAGRLACDASDRFAAVVVVAGGTGHLPPCRPDRPVSVLDIHGTDDPVVPYRGRLDDDEPGGVPGWVMRWAQRDGCPPMPLRRRVLPKVLREDWQPCRGGAAVAHIEVVGGEHAWPGATPPDPGPQSGLSAGWEAWRFVSGHRLAPAPRR